MQYRHIAQAQLAAAREAEAVEMLPVVTFELAGQQYHVYRYPDRLDSNAERHYWKTVDGRQVGTMVVARKRYTIVERAVPAASGESFVDPVDVLTNRELQVVSLVADGYVNKEVAARLRISAWTVSTHLRRIFAKLNVDSRAAMVFRCGAALEGLREGPQLVHAAEARHR